jgi:hypothetical protein
LPRPGSRIAPGPSISINPRCGGRKGEVAEPDSKFGYSDLLKGQKIDHRITAKAPMNGIRSQIVRDYRPGWRARRPPRSPLPSGRPPGADRPSPAAARSRYRRCPSVGRRLAAAAAT